MLIVYTECSIRVQNVNYKLSTTLLPGILIPLSYINLLQFLLLFQLIYSNTFNKFLVFKVCGNIETTAIYFRLILSNYYSVMNCVTDYIFDTNVYS